MSEQEHRYSHQTGEHQVEPPSIIGILTHSLEVLLPHEVAHADGHRRRHARQDKVEELGGGNHHLVGSQRNRSEPSHHHATQREGRRLHCQLQCHWPSHAVHLLEVCLVDAAGEDVVAVLAEFLVACYHAHHRQCHQDTRQESGDACSEQSQLRKRPHTVDEHPVAKDVDHVAAYHHPHRHLGVGDTIEKLFHGVEHTHEQHRYEVDNEVRTDERQQFLGLSDMGKVEVEDDEGKRKDTSHHHVGDEGVAYLLSDFLRALHAIELADDRSEAVGEAHVGDEHESEDIVDQSCRRQFLSAMMSYHEGVGET